MSHLLAKVKRHATPYRVLENQNVYQLPTNLNTSILYNPATIIDNAEWYRINEFSIKEYFLDYLGNEFVPVDYNQITNNSYTKIDYLCYIRDNHYYFQNISSKQLVEKKVLSLSGGATFTTDNRIIVVNNEADAIYDKENDILYFKKLTIIKGIFPGIDVIYREATDAETQQFLDNDFLNLPEGFLAGNVHVPNRKRIALILDTVNNFTPEQREEYFNYMHPYTQNLNFNNGAFDIQNENDLTLVIYGIEQRFYTTPFGHERRIANSVIPIPAQP
jgi:hypothetical protein